MRRFFGKMLSLAVAFVMMASAIPSMNAVAQSKMDFTAADYLSLPDLRKEAMSGWHQTYAAKGREVIANVDIRWMPEAQTCPIVQVEGWGKQADPKAFEPYKDKPNTRSAQRDFLIAVGLVDRDTKVFPKRTNYHGRTVTPQQLTLYGGEVPAQTPENVDLDYAGFLQKVNEDIGSFSKFKRSLTVPMGYGDYFYSAQTGELIPTSILTEREDPLPAREIVTWESLKP